MSYTCETCNFYGVYCKDSKLAPCCYCLPYEDRPGWEKQTCETCCWMVNWIVNQIPCDSCKIYNKYTGEIIFKNWQYDDNAKD